MIGRVQSASAPGGPWSARIFRMAELAQLRRRYAGERLVYCSGSFDLTHAGHVLFLEDCRALGKRLVVGVGCDAAVRRLKGSGRPVLNEHLRLAMIASLRAVDGCFLDTNVSAEPLEGLAGILGALRPDLYAMNADAYDIAARREIATRAGVPLAVLERACPPEFEAISSSGIIARLGARGG